MPDFFKGPVRESKPGEPGYHGDIKDFGTYEKPYERLEPRTPLSFYAAFLITVGLGALILAATCLQKQYPAEPRSHYEVPRAEYAIGQESNYRLY